jgi:probable FeS assembly SUF system protein SufT
VYFDAASLPYLQDIKIDLGKTGRWETLTISAPNAKKSAEPSRDLVLPVECTGLRVPHGTPVTIPAGGKATITQALGGSYTINYEGNLYRLDPEQAKKVGLNPNVLMFEPPEDGSISEEQCYEAMRQVYDPEIPVNVVSLGLVYKLEINQETKAVNVEMTLTSPGCGMGSVISADLQEKLSQVPHVEKSEVDIVFDPPWSYDMLSEEGRLELGLI